MRVILIFLIFLPTVFCQVDFEIPKLPNMVPSLDCADCEMLRPGSYREAVELIENVTLWRDRDGEYVHERIPMNQKQQYYMADGTNFFENKDAYMRFLSRKCFELSTNQTSPVNVSGQWERELAKGFSDFTTPTREVNYSYHLERQSRIKISYSVVYELEQSLIHSRDIEQHSAFLNSCFDSIEEQFSHYGVDLEITRRIKNIDDYYVGRNPVPDQRLLYRLENCGSLRERTLYRGEGCEFRAGRERPIEDSEEMRCNRLMWMTGIQLGLRDEEITTGSDTNIMTLRSRRVESGDFSFEPQQLKQILKPICPGIERITHP